MVQLIQSDCFSQVVIGPAAALSASAARATKERTHFMVDDHEVNLRRRVEATVLDACDGFLIWSAGFGRRRSRSDASDCSRPDLKYRTGELLIDN